MDIFPIKINGLIPPKRSGSAGFIHNDNIYIYGGIARNILFADLWKLNLKTWKWSLIELKNYPEKRWGHTFNFIKLTAVLFGGRCGSKPQNMGCIYHFDLNSINKWGQFEITSNQKPKKRYAHLTLKKEDEIIIFGGHGGRARFYNDIWILKENNGVFSWVEITTTGEIPEARSQSGGVYHQNKLYVIGGTNNQREFSDICILDWETKIWNRINVSVLQLYKHTVSLIPKTNKLFIFGGKYTDKKKSYFWEETSMGYNTETIGFDLDTNQTFVIPKHQTLTCCRAGHLFLNRNNNFFSVFGETKEKYETNKVIKISINHEYSKPKSLPDAFIEISELRKIISTLSEEIILMKEKIKKLNS